MVFFSPTAALVAITSGPSKSNIFRNANLSKWYFYENLPKLFAAFDKFLSVVIFFLVAVFCDYYVIHIK